MLPRSPSRPRSASTHKHTRAHFLLTKHTTHARTNKHETRSFMDAKRAAMPAGAKVWTELEPLKMYHPAEDYHQVKGGFVVVCVVVVVCSCSCV